MDVCVLKTHMYTDHFVLVRRGIPISIPSTNCGGKMSNDPVA